LIQSLAKHYKFDIETPWEELPEKVRKLILQGSGDESVAFTYTNERGSKSTRRHPFEGVLPNMERRYRETESMMVREELSKYLSARPCPDCGGTRLKREARNVFVAGQSLPALTGRSVGDTLRFFDELALDGRRGEIAAKIVKEIRARVSFLVN